MPQRPGTQGRDASFLVIKAWPGDQGVRPLAAPFAAATITCEGDGRPRVTVWNLGSREVEGVVTEFYTIRAGLPVQAEHAVLIGPGNPSIIAPRQAVSIACTELWRRTSPADLLLVMAYHPTHDPVTQPYDAMADRHVGQMNYPWAGRYEGQVGQEPRRVVIELKPASQGLFRLRLFEEAGGRLASFPRCDRVMKPNGHAFRWLEVEGDQRMLFDLALLDNNLLSLVVRPRHAGGAQELERGLLTRVFTQQAAGSFA